MFPGFYCLHSLPCEEPQAFEDDVDEQRGSGGDDVEHARVVEKAVAACRGVVLPQLLMALQMVFSSLLRPKELRLVQIKHIDVERRAIRVPGDNAKTHNERFAPLSAQMAKRLESMGLEKFPKDYYLFGIGTDMMPDKKPIAEARLRKEWEKLRAALDMPPEMQLYSLRDTGINAMLKSGLDPLTVMQAADHHDLAMTTRYANHADPLIINKVYENSPKF